MQNILIVDDSLSIRFLLKSTLQKAGFGVTEADNGQSALLKLQESATAPDLIICDYNMPQLNGIEFLEKLGEQNASGCPVIMLTTETNPAILDKCRKLGATEFLRKPINPSELDQAMRKIFLTKSGP